MNSIFFDLETSDKHFIGQILNYNFQYLDSRFELISELSGEILLSRLELPSPHAILANRVNVLEHQKTAKRSELQACIEIARFIDSCVKHARGEVALIGYNSARFDVPYLRTSLIRNGINPYFGGKIAYRDVIHAVKKLFVSNADFQESILEHSRKLASSSSQQLEPKLSLKLESVSQALGILQGQQEHDSKADVDLLVALVKDFLKLYKFDVRDYVAYDVPESIERKGRGSAICCFEPEYSLKASSPVNRRELVFVDSDHRAALWLDVERFNQHSGTADERKSIYYYNKRNANLIFDRELSKSDKSLESAIIAVRGKFSKITLSNFFTRSECDIELNIHRIDISILDLLSEAIRSLDPSRLKTLTHRDALVLFTRFKLKVAPADAIANDSQFQEALRKYAIYRYGGEAQSQRTVPDDENAEIECLPSLKQMLEELDQLSAASDDKQDRELLASLRKYYLDSEIVKVSGDELLQGIVT